MNHGTIRKVRSLLILVSDLVLLFITFSAFYLLRLKKLPDYESVDIWLISGTFIVTLYLSGTYFRERSSTSPELPVRAFFTSIIAGTICIVWMYLLGPSEFNDYFGRGVLPLSTLVFGSFASIARYIINNFYFMQEKGVELLYLGYSKSWLAFAQELKNHSEVRAVTMVSDHCPEETYTEFNVEPLPLTQAIVDRNWQAIIVDPEHSPDEHEKSILIKARLSGTPVVSLTDYYETNWFMVPVSNISDEWFLRSQGFSMLGRPVSNRIKRIIDVSLATILLLASIPVLVLCSFAIKVTSTGPVLFRQTRVGYQGEHFTIYKLRTMRENAEKNGAQWAEKNDPRITRVGNFLRRSRLDEIPQCWNVLNGTMSFVGPRPERPEFTQKLNRAIPYYDLRHIVKPGISGWAQVIFPYGSSTEDALKKLQYELYYIKNQSLLLDLNIMIRTLFTVFQRAGR